MVAGPLFGAIANAAGISGVVAGLVGYLRWPIGAIALLTAFAIVYALGPRRTPRKGDRSLHSVLAGAAIGMPSGWPFRCSSPPMSPISVLMTRRTAPSAR